MIKLFPANEVGLMVMKFFLIFVLLMLVSCNIPSIMKIDYTVINSSNFNVTINIDSEYMIPANSTKTINTRLESVVGSSYNHIDINYNNNDYSYYNPGLDGPTDAWFGTTGSFDVGVELLSNEVVFSGDYKDEWELWDLYFSDYQ